MPQSYGFIFISARDFWEKLLKKLENHVLYMHSKGINFLLIDSPNSLPIFAISTESWPLPVRTR